MSEEKKKGFEKTRRTANLFAVSAGFGIRHVIECHFDSSFLL
jgi:hypothetical protein